MIVTFVILGVTLVLFIWDKLRADVVAMLSLLSLFVAGVIDSKQALAGFGDSSVILVAALFVVGEGLMQTGVTAWLGARMLKLAGKSSLRLVTLSMSSTGLLSGVMSNTGSTATFMPAVVSAAWGVGSVPAKFLIPLAFAATGGGLLTLMGTPPNVIVAEAMTLAGLEPFGFFEFGLVGLPLLFIMILYMVFIGMRLLPSRQSGVPPVDIRASVGELADEYSLHGKFFRLHVQPNSPVRDKTLAESGLGSEYEITVLRVERPHSNGNGAVQPVAPVRVGLERLRHHDDVALPNGHTPLRVDDTLLVRATAELVQRAEQELDLDTKVVDEQREPLIGTLVSREVGLAELLVTPRSEYIGRTLADCQFYNRFGVQVIGIRRHDQIAKRQRVKLDFGDSLLVRGPWESIQRIAEERRNFVVVGSPEAMAQQVETLDRHAFIAIGVLVGMVIIMVTGLVPTVIAALMAAGAMVLTNCLRPSQAYRSVTWQSVVLIAAMIPMSTAMAETGGAEYIANGLVGVLGGLHPYALLAGIFLLTAGFSQIISNTATTVLVVPIVLQTAAAIGVSPAPLLMMTAVGASAAFLTPIATPANCIVMSPGGYQFRDYALVGLPLFLLFLLFGMVWVPWIWPL